MSRVMRVIIVTALLLFGINVVGAAAGEGQQAAGELSGLTLEQAVERALMYSIKVELAEKDVDRAWEVREAARDWHIYNLTKTISTGDLYVSTEGADEDSYFRFLSANAQWTIQKKMLDITRDAIILQAKNNYYNVLKTQRKLETAKLALEKAESDYRKVKAMALVGMATALEVQAAKSEMEMKRSAVEQAKADLENAYRALNKLIGLPPEERPVLITPIEFEKIEVPSLENKIAWALSPDNNPYLWSKKEGYELRKYTWTFAESDEAGLIDKEKAALDYQDARKETRNKMYELYDTLMTLEASYESAKEGVAAAEEALRTAEAMYDVGMATKNDVLAKKVALEEAKAALLNVKSLYSLTKETFEKPWLALIEGGGSGSSESPAAGSVSTGQA